MTRAIMTPEASARLSRTGILAQDVSRLKYVSGAREEALRRLGTETVETSSFIFRGAISISRVATVSRPRRWGRCAPS